MKKKLGISSFLFDKSLLSFHKEKIKKRKFMEFEFVEFYPAVLDFKNKKDRKKIMGSAHIYAYEGKITMDLRGLLVLRHKDNIIIRMPSRTVLDHETGKNVTYPIFSFGDQNHQKALFEWLKTEGVEHVKKCIKEQKITDKKVQEMKKNIAIKKEVL